MAKRLQQQALLEIALSLGGESDPHRLLSRSLPLIVRRSASSAAGVICIDGTTAETVQVTPAAMRKRPEWLDVTARAVASSLDATEPAWLLEGDGPLTHHVFRLRGFGLLVISRPTPFEDSFVRAFLPVAEVLARPLVADLEQRRRQAVELDLSQMEQRQRGLLDALPFAAWLEDLEGRFTEVNAAFESWTGRDRASIITRLPSEILPEGQGTSYRRATSEVLRTGEPATTQEFDRDSGQVHEQHRVPYRSTHGAIQGVVGFRRDVTEDVQAQRRLEDQAAFQQILMSLAVGFTNTPLGELPEAIDAALARTGEFATIDRAYVFAYDVDAGTTSNTYEWCAPGIDAAIDELQGVPFEALPDWVETHLRGELVHVPDVAALANDDPLRQILESQGILTLIAVPLFAEGQCLGFVGFDAVRARKDWTDGERQLLLVLAELIANAESRRVREAALLEARALAEVTSDRLELALQAGTDAIWEWNPTTGQAYYSAALLRMVGRDDEAHTGDLSLLRELVHPDYLRDIERDWGLLTRSGDRRAEGDADGSLSRMEAEIRLRHVLGHEVPALVRGAVFLAADGTPSRMAGILADLTLEKRAQAHASRRLLHEATLARISARFVNPEGFDAATHAALADLGTIYEASRASLLLLDHDTQTVHSTHEWCAPGVDSAIAQNQDLPLEGLGEDLPSLRQGQPVLIGDVDALPETSASLRELLRAGRVRSLLVLPLMVGGKLEAIIGLAQVERTEIWSLDDASLLRAATELMAGALARSRTEQALVMALERAEVASEAKSTFLSTISHELRTPMNGVLGMTELLMEGTLDDRQRGYVAAARTSAAALLTLLDELLDVARIESGEMVLTRTPTDLGEMVHAVVEAARLHPHADGVDIQVRMDPTIPSLVWTDPDRLRQIVTNLVGNAVKFTPAGAVRIRLDRNDDDHDGPVGLRLTVSDTGIGISAESLPTVCQPFVQAAPVDTRRMGGSGLGLAIVSELVRMMAGTVHIASEVGVGTTVTVEVRLDEVSGPTITPPVATHAPSLVGRELKILLAEDNLVNQEVFRGFLDDLDAKLDIVRDGGGAVDAHAKDRYDIILMDCFMPDVDGLRATREIRGREATLPVPRTPILAVTADASEEHAAACLRTGMDAVLTKPFDRSGLLRAIAELLPPQRGAEHTIVPPVGVTEPDIAEPEVAAGTDRSGDAGRDDASPPVLDPAPLQVLRSHTGPDGPLSDRLVSLFAEHGPQYVEEMKTGAEHADRPRFRRAAHTLKSNAATLGLLRLTEACREAESLVTSSAPTDPTVPLERLVEAAAAVDHELRQGLAALNAVCASGGAVHP